MLWEAYPIERYQVQDLATPNANLSHNENSGCIAQNKVDYKIEMRTFRALLLLAAGHVAMASEVPAPRGEQAAMEVEADGSAHAVKHVRRAAAVKQ